jgi:hypothetical protein
MSFEPVFARLRELMPVLDTHPGKTVQACRLIEEWLESGHDAELDILPAINTTWARTPTGVIPSSAAYFDKAVRRAREERVGSAEADRKKAERVAWLRDRMPGRIDCQLRAWMDRYEREHGPVPSP